VYAFLLGILLGWLALEFKNLTASVMFHLGFNISSLPLIFAQGKGSWSYAVVLRNPFFLSAIVAVCGALSFYLLFKLKRKEA
jgi:hypothetical protein